MQLVTLSKVDPIGIWVEGFPVFVPFLDSVLVPDARAYELADEWKTDLLFLNRTLMYDYLVYLPPKVRPTVEWCAESLGLV